VSDLKIKTSIHFKFKTKPLIKKLSGFVIVNTPE